MPVKKMEPLEKKYGKSMSAILAELYSELGDHKLVAERLDVTMKTLWQWRKALECETVIRIDCAASRPRSDA